MCRRRPSCVDGSGRSRWAWTVKVSAILCRGPDPDRDVSIQKTRGRPTKNQAPPRNGPTPPGRRGFRRSDPAPFQVRHRALRMPTMYRDPILEAFDHATREPPRAGARGLAFPGGDRGRPGGPGRALAAGATWTPGPAPRLAGRGWRRRTVPVSWRRSWRSGGAGWCRCSWSRRRRRRSGTGWRTASAASGPSPAPTAGRGRRRTGSSAAGVPGSRRGCGRGPIGSTRAPRRSS